jgi:hypothetical protein
MKVLVEDVKGEGLISFLGKPITLYCANYIYTGKLIVVNETCVKLSEAKVVYETGSYSDKDWKDAQSLPNDWYVQLSFVESFGILK